MSILILVFVAFLVLHSLPSMPALRNRLIARMGRRVYLLVYSILSLASLAGLIVAFAMAPEVVFWPEYAWQAWITLLLAPLGLFLVVCGLLSPNPSSISFRRGERSGAIVAITRHPVLIGFFLLFASHIFPNGEERALILFGGFSLYALVGIIMLERRGRIRAGSDWGRIVGKTSIIPCLALLRGDVRFTMDREFILSFFATAVLTFGLLFAAHEVLFGVDPLLLALYGAW
ncbi:NnrU family protein [Allorhizobium sp. BGMRC 0089]|nr:NnrU family protein [Allorhizobium sonneratiae]